jgi:NAD(P)-dependent dehydrogenase (short-subunit alcohol dehydrogenase family)
LITGADGGLGTAVTRAFLDAEARVVGVSPNITVAEFANPLFTAMPADVSSRESANALVEAVLAKAGAIDVLVHLVGAFAGGKSVAETDDATFDRMFNLNFRTSLNMFRAVLPGMRAQKSGCVLAIGSRTALEPQPNVGAYSASKAALVSLMQTVALENKDRGISANVILPGTMDTPANRASMPSADASKWVPPAQVAALLVHLAANRGVTGAAIPVYGAQL